MLGIRGRLLALSLGIAVPLAAIGLVVMRGFWRESRSQLDRSVERQAQLAAVAFERWIEGQRQPLVTLAAQAEKEPPQRTKIFFDETLPLILDNRPHWIDLYIIDGNGVIKHAQTRRQNKSEKDAALSAEALPSGIVKDVFAELARRHSWAVVTDWTRDAADNKNLPIILIAAPIREPATQGATGGAVVARIDGRAIGELFRDIKLSNGGIIAVFDSHRRILYRSPTPESYIGADISDTPLFVALAERQTTTLESVSPYDDVRRIYGLARAGDTDSVIIIGTPTSVLLEPARRQFIRYAIFSLFALLCAAVAAIFLARSIVRPVSDLERAAQALGAGSLAARAPVKGDDEFSKLGRAFNQMAIRIEDREARLTELDRLKSEFVSSVSHELRTPLTTIKTLTRLLLRHGSLTADQREHLETIAVECDRQIDLVVNLLDLSRIEAGAFTMSLTAVEAGDLLRASAASMRHLLELRNQELRVVVLDDSPPIKADAGVLRRVVSSLIENAVKYTDDGGQITLRAGRDKVHADILAIEVADTGRGIAAEDLPHIFEKFYRGRAISNTAEEDKLSPAMNASKSNDAPGVGLGLYLARQMVERMNGALEVESRVGRGSTFIIRLPIWNAFNMNEDEPSQRVENVHATKSNL